MTYPGVDRQRNYRQTIIQRCYEGIWPPIQVFVSDGILAPNAADKVCYVIYVSESWEAPHFLTKRRGAWIRTDEFSQRFETRLATFEEIQHLTNRRTLAVERHEYLYTRAVGRFEALAAREYSNHPEASGSIGSNTVPEPLSTVSNTSIDCGSPTCGRHKIGKNSLAGRGLSIRQGDYHSTRQCARLAPNSSFLRSRGERVGPVDVFLRGRALSQ